MVGSIADYYKQGVWYVIQVHRTLLLIGFALVAIAAPAGASENVRVGDKLNVMVYNHPELSSQPIVDASGRVSLPLAGSLDAARSSTSDLASRITARLRPYVREVAVDVQVLQQSNSIFVSGGPGGVLTYAPGETLTGAVSQALQQSHQVGSASNSTTSVQAIDPQRGPVDLRSVKIVRDGKILGPYDVGALVARGEPGPNVEPGDTIGLADKPVTVTVIGAVAAPGTAHLYPNEPLQNALAQVGGVDQVTSSTTLALARGGQTIHLTSSSPEYNQPAQNGDVITVPQLAHIAVVGNVAKPGEVQLRGNPTLVGAIYYAGGPASVGDLRNVQVVHQGQTTVYDITKFTLDGAGRDPQLADGDTVFVPAGKQKADTQGFFHYLFSTVLRYTLPIPLGH